jgi:hypothetical protein
MAFAKPNLKSRISLSDLQTIGDTRPRFRLHSQRLSVPIAHSAVARMSSSVETGIAASRQGCSGIGEQQK